MVANFDRRYDAKSVSQFRRCLECHGRGPSMSAFLFDTFHVPLISKPPEMRNFSEGSMNFGVIGVGGAQQIPPGFETRHPLHSIHCSKIGLLRRYNGRTGPHWRASLTTACMYGRFRASENVGIRDRPTTVSSSACARRCTSVFVTIASAHQYIVVDIVSTPAALSEEV
ncbi:hypothetical protein EDB86DRAFT_376999, partial [Lactarius hatsudake]